MSLFSLDLFDIVQWLVCKTEATFFNQWEAKWKPIVTDSHVSYPCLAAAIISSSSDHSLHSAVYLCCDWPYLKYNFIVIFWQWIKNSSINLIWITNSPSAHCISVFPKLVFLSPRCCSSAFTIMMLVTNWHLFVLPFVFPAQVYHYFNVKGRAIMYDKDVVLLQVWHLFIP